MMIKANMPCLFRPLCVEFSVLTQALPFFLIQALILPEKFQHILRVLNTNIDGKQKIMFAITAIKVSGTLSFRS